MVKQKSESRKQKNIPGTVALRWSPTEPRQDLSVQSKSAWKADFENGT